MSIISYPKIRMAFCFLTAAVVQSTAQGQWNILPDSEALKKNKVSELMVENCIENSGCYRDHYEFNECGEVLFFMPPMINCYFKSEYDDNCRVLFHYTMNHSFKDSDSIYFFNEYNYLVEDSVDITSYYMKEGREVVDDHVRTSLPLKDQPKDNEVFDKNGRIISHTTGHISYPCGIIFEGNHLFEYEYLENGLISSARITNEEKEVVVDLKYNYEFFE